MIKTLPILFFIYFTLYTSAQKCEYEEYFRFTDLAKKAFNTENFKDARKSFKLAFKETIFPLGHDLSYALIAANETKDYEWAGQIAKKLAQGGVPLRYFIRYKKKKWHKEFKSSFNSYNAYYEECFDQEMKKRLLQIEQNDFEFTTKYHDWRARKIELQIQELIDGATKIVVDFKSFKEKYGFPNEREMGYNYIHIKNRIEPYKTDVLMVHIYQMGTPIFRNNIHDFACEGSLHTNFEEVIEKIQGFGDSTGIEQEMRARYKKFR